MTHKHPRRSCKDPARRLTPIARCQPTHTIPVSRVSLRLEQAHSPLQNHKQWFAAFGTSSKTNGTTGLGGNRPNALLAGKHPGPPIACTRSARAPAAVPRRLGQVNNATRRFYQRELPAGITDAVPAFLAYSRAARHPRRAPASDGVHTGIPRLAKHRRTRRIKTGGRA